MPPQKVLIYKSKPIPLFVLMMAATLFGAAIGFTLALWLLSAA